MSMDVLFFLKERTRLIRQYYVHAASPFNEIIRKIEAGGKTLSGFCLLPFCYMMGGGSVYLASEWRLSS